MTHNIYDNDNMDAMIHQAHSKKQLKAVKKELLAKGHSIETIQQRVAINDAFAKQEKAHHNMKEVVHLIDSPKKLRAFKKFLKSEGYSHEYIDQKMEYAVEILKKNKLLAKKEDNAQRAKDIYFQDKTAKPADFPIITATVLFGTIKKLKYYIKLRNNINELDYANRTALIHACKKGNAEQVELLLKADARIKPKDVFGKRAYDYALDSKNEKVIELMADRCADLEINKIIPYEGAKSLFNDYHLMIGEAKTKENQ